ncbi:MAG TPA: hypothetical protein VLD62_12185 [Acidimicrobiia bacterium]|jgi:hypothetical protein|nr:hypothetical protein [Acidimicrobiia bacterium]
MTTCPIPHRPADLGLEERCPDLAQIEGAHLLANKARPFLEGCGFDDSRILKWAELYICEEGSGDVESFVAWIHSAQRVA